MKDACDPVWIAGTSSSSVRPTLATLAAPQLSRVHHAIPDMPVLIVSYREVAELRDR